MQFPSLRERSPGVWLIIAASVVACVLLSLDQGEGGETTENEDISTLSASINRPVMAGFDGRSSSDETEIIIAQATPEPPAVDEEEAETTEELEMPPTVRLPPAGSERCQKALGVYRARLRARQRTLAAARTALEDEKIRVEDIQLEVEQRWKLAAVEWDLAESLAEISNKKCKTIPPDAADLGGMDLGLDKIDPEERVNQVVAIIKSMKPAAAAAVIERWNHPLATTALRRLSPRIASKIIAEMPEELATRLTVDMLKGKELPKSE